ncbi:MAG: hypothetical protein HUK02_09855 [Bacteroidaceae bacterium]|nr:hypothetical protein [Bacteroidaceae bacterium]
MKRAIIILCLLAAVCGGSKAQVKDSIDTAQFVAVYDYECKTQDDEGNDVTDKMSVVVQVGKTVVKSMPFSAYARIVEVSKSDLAGGSPGGIYAHADSVDGTGARGIAHHVT